MCAANQVCVFSLCNFNSQFRLNSKQATSRRWRVNFWGSFAIFSLFFPTSRRYRNNSSPQVVRPHSFATIRFNCFVQLAGRRAADSVGQLHANCTWRANLLAVANCLPAECLCKQRTEASKRHQHEPLVVRNAVDAFTFRCSAKSAAPNWRHLRKRDAPPRRVVGRREKVPQKKRKLVAFRMRMSCRRTEVRQMLVAQLVSRRRRRRRRL